jgi:hypothetical protein
MSEKVGIEHLLKVIKALGDTLAIGGEVMADGKIGFGDLFKLPELMSCVNSIVSAAKEAPAEIKDLNGEELQQVVVALVAAVAKVTGKK